LRCPKCNTLTPVPDLIPAEEVPVVEATVSRPKPKPKPVLAEAPDDDEEDERPRKKKRPATPTMTTTTTARARSAETGAVEVAAHSLRCSSSAGYCFWPGPGSRSTSSPGRDLRSPKRRRCRQGGSSSVTPTTGSRRTFRASRWW